jgi:hypothetical protein
VSDHHGVFAWTGINCISLTSVIRSPHELLILNNKKSNGYLKRDCQDGDIFDKKNPKAQVSPQASAHEEHMQLDFFPNILCRNEKSIHTHLVDPILAKTAIVNKDARLHF